MLTVIFIGIFDQNGCYPEILRTVVPYHLLIKSIFTLMDMQKKNRTPVKVLFNVIFPSSHPSSVNTQVNKELDYHHAKSTYTFCGLGESKCKKIHVFQALGIGVYFGSYLIGNGGTFTHLPRAQAINLFLGCSPMYIGAFPLKSNGGCKCVCPDGYEFMPTGLKHQFICEKKIIPHTFNCRNAAHDACYAVDTDGHFLKSWDSECELVNFFNTDIVLPLPFSSWKTLDYMVDFEFTKADGNAKPTETFTPQKALNKWPKILDDVTEFNQAGSYQLKITAYNRYHIEICTADFMISDNIAPVVDPISAPCPRGLTLPADGNSIMNPIELNSNSILTGVRSVFINYKKHVSTRDDDPCGTGEVCDIIYHTVKRWGQTTFETGDPDKWNTVFTFTQRDFTILQNIQKNIVTKSPPGSPETKCWKIDHTFGENVGLYTCNAGKGGTSCLTGGVCDFTQCVKYIGSNFLQADSSIRTTIQKRTSMIAAELGIDDFTLSASTIYEIVDAKQVGDSNGVKTYDLCKVFSIDRVYTAFGQSTLSGITPENAIACRYRLDGGEWLKFHFDAPNIVTFVQSETSLNLECWSSIGLIYQNSYPVFLYPHASLERVCNLFETDTFSSTLTDQHLHPGLFCNVKGSPFSEVLFTFNEQSSREVTEVVAAQFHFQQMRCSAKFVEEQGGVYNGVSQNVPLWSQGSQDNSLHLHRVGVSLIKEETTQPVTMVQFSCEMDYKSNLGVAETLDCRHVVSFTDCDAPLFPDDEETNVYESCKDSGNCANKIQPNGYCGGNHLYLAHENNQDIAHYDKNQRESCCTECGDFECLNLARTSLGSDKTLKQCTLPNIGYHQEQVVLAAQLPSSVFTIAFLAVSVLLFAFVRTRGAAHPVDESDYFALL